MTNLYRLGEIAAWMVSDPDVVSDGQEVTKAYYEIKRLRRIVSQLPLETVHRLAYVSEQKEKRDEL